MGDVKSFRLSKNYNDNNDLNWFFSDLIFLAYYRPSLLITKGGVEEHLKYQSEKWRSRFLKRILCKQWII